MTTDDFPERVRAALEFVASIPTERLLTFNRARRHASEQQRLADAIFGDQSIEASEMMPFRKGDSLEDIVHGYKQDLFPEDFRP